jgi:regulator of protease activity HflC (stomatin/prohibitin superfamily)
VSAKNIERLQRLTSELLSVARCALADLEGIMPEFEPDGDREHPAWQTIAELKQAIIKAEAEAEQSEQVWEFTFKCVQAAESRDEALSAALEYLAEYADKGELEPTDSQLLDEGDYDVVQ